MRRAALDQNSERGVGRPVLFVTRPRGGEKFLWGTKEEGLADYVLEYIGMAPIADAADSRQPLVFFTAWFCPFAQRAWIALEEKGVPYELVECELYEGDASSKVSLSLSEKHRRNPPEFARASPFGLVPALHDPARRDGAYVNESLVCLHYIDEAFECGPALMPTDALSRARIRTAICFFDEKVRPQFYAVLMREGEAGRAEAVAALNAGWLALAARLAPPEEGPYFLGAEFSAFECAVLPWFQRLEPVLGHWRGYALPSTQPFERWRVWYSACLARPGYSRTRVDRERLIANYAGYADNRATSDAAESTRRSVGAAPPAKRSHCETAQQEGSESKR